MTKIEALQIAPCAAGSFTLEREDSSSAEYELAQRAAKGDMEAFALIYQTYYRRVYGLTFRMTRNVVEAEDLTQDVFVHLYKKIGSFRGESAFATWLHRFTFNRVLMHFRKSSVKRERTTEDGETPLQVSPGTDNPHQMAIYDRMLLDQAITQLPHGYRITFVLHDVEGYEHAEIARMLGCSVGTTKSQLHKARMKLRKLLSR
jgi:RNA polymerase sigma-70 factor (ECF subfamily)